MIIEFTMGDQLEKTYKFINPIDLAVVGDVTTIGYLDENGVYQRATCATPKKTLYLQISI